MIRYIRNLFEQEKKEDYYQPVRIGNFWSRNYIEYESNGDRDKKKHYQFKNILMKLDHI